MFLHPFINSLDAAQHSYMQKKVQVVSQPYSVKNSSSFAQCFSFRNMICLCKFSLHNRKCTKRFYCYNWVLQLSWWLRKINSYKHLLKMFFYISFMLFCFKHGRMLSKFWNQCWHKQTHFWNKEIINEKVMEKWIFDFYNYVQIVWPITLWAKFCCVSTDLKSA